MKELTKLIMMMGAVGMFNSAASAASVANSASVRDYAKTFKCVLTADFGEMDGILKRDFIPASNLENYFQSVRHLDLKVTAMYDEAGHSYTVEATGANGYHVKSTIPYYPDANLRFSYDLHDAHGKFVAFTEFVAQCRK